MPSLTGLVTFATVARHDSFSSAAEELGVSQPAVSHAIRLLERWFGCQLFERDHRGIRLTKAGEILAAGVSGGLAQLHQAVRNVQVLHQAMGEVVTISVSTATATNWLIPRLARFKTSHPEIDVRCVTTDSDHHFDSSTVDLFVPVGRARWPGCRRWPLLTETVYPVCRPDYAASLGPMPWTVEQLNEVTTLQLAERHRSRMRWDEWYAALDLPVATGPSEQITNDYTVLLQAALEGQGVALGWHHLVADLVERGLLVRPVVESVTTDEPLWILAPPGRQITSAAEALRDWLIAAS